jgi:YegS/Rv2252/BmrU family lipid kinase
MRHLFIINPKSFYKNPTLREMIAAIRLFFKSRDRPIYSIHVSRYPRDAVSVIHKIASGAEDKETLRVYAVGGDGILFDCLNGIINLPNTELAAIPYGKSNDFVRAFGEDKNALFRDLEAQIKAPVIPMDVIYCGSNYALNVCTIGLESTSLVNMKKINQSYRKFLDRFPALYNSLFFFGGALSLFDKRIMSQYYTISLDGDDYSRQYSTINISNGPCYGGDKGAAPQAVPNDGILDVLLFKSISFFRALKVLYGYFYGRTPPECLYRRGKKLTIRSNLPLIIELDGELFFDTNITVEIVPQGVNFAVPRGVSLKTKKAGNNE